MIQKEFKIENKVIKQGQSFIIAEAGINHNGNIDTAVKLVDEAKKCGADSVKFQTYKTENLVIKKAPLATYQKQAQKNLQDQFELLKKYELSFENFEYLKEYCDEKGITFLSSPFDVESAKFLSQIEVSSFKVPSGELLNSPLITIIAKTKKPVIISTGMSDLCDIQYVLNNFYGENNYKIALLHCVSNYPAKVEDYNLKAIKTLKLTFGHPTGVSDHSPGYIVPVMSIALGGVIIEKHFTLDKNMEGPDHKASLDIEEFKEMVKAVRSAEKALGDGVKRPVPSELAIANIAKKSITSSKDIKKGEYFTYENISIRRPGTGINPKNLYLVVGRKAKRNIEKDSVITWDLVE